jgi:CheY-like chemotaxis protein
MKILVVEDNEVNQKVVRAIFRRNNIIFELANDGDEALKKLKDEKFDLILMDCQMPILDGYQTTKIIREEEQKENKKRCPIIAVTANAMSGDKDRCLSAGMDDFLSKPFQTRQIIEMIEKWKSPG